MDSVIRYLCMLEIISVAPKDGFTTSIALATSSSLRLLCSLEDEW